ncbi:concanavalin A-like lectin/glucanase domain-containing protein [Clohesyomyces aquaticus]|uniref:endo-1,4-beta-xylanase n=1 Tax=Clohesyomyces aquaticus TaxID=1231657 RepID=A0A1Y1ZYP0_9PLEO|nr:concanavalin A-like lectin/glucanase domain-containing protein [Clohesyomyces aquaticus]
MSFTSVVVAAAVALGAIAAPADPQLGSAAHNLVKRTTPNSSGCSDGFWYQFWSEGGGGQVTYTNKAGGEYSVTWNNCKDFTSGKGWRNATGRTIKYSGSFSLGSNSYLAVYTWSQRGETYILENYGGYNPGTAGGQHKGTLTSDGRTYDIYRVDRGNGYMQFWSIRQGKRSSGIVTTKNHYDKYNSLGLVFDPAKNATYQILSTEGYGSTGNADLTVAEILNIQMKTFYGYLLSFQARCGLNITLL